MSSGSYINNPHRPQRKPLAKNDPAKFKIHKQSTSLQSLHTREGKDKENVDPQGGKKPSRRDKHLGSGTASTTPITPFRVLQTPVNQKPASHYRNHGMATPRATRGGELQSSTWSPSSSSSSSPFVEEPAPSNTPHAGHDHQLSTKSAAKLPPLQHPQTHRPPSLASALAPTTTPLNFHHFEIGRCLGKGKLGRVYCALYRPYNYLVALKVMSIAEIKQNQIERNFRREIEIQSVLSHANITRLYSWFHDEINVYLVLEYGEGGELYNHLQRCKRFTGLQASYYIYQIALALQYLHRRHIVHRDLKPENIMRCENDVVKLCDFGWSVYTKRKISSSSSTTTNGAASYSSRRLTFCGTIDYLPPEMIERKPHDHHVDIWALGVLCYEFLVGKPPFEEVDKNATYKRIAAVDLKFPLHHKHVEPDARDLIARLLRKKPEDRLSLGLVLKHPWIVKHMPQWPTRNN
ncbi:uncharacterized protein LODBEIA_P41440 [Lodderomyces beijingensis]|uniref:Aurora kinase n=1 Tax=Lodderomyces beijingensis TaxID=1775926 RepID=A0ABP0ZRU6_9ASCO